MVSKADKNRLKSWSREMSDAVLSHPAYLLFDDQESVQLVYKYGALFLGKINELTQEIDKED